MQLKANQLEMHLQKHLCPIYLISGDEPLLKQEARDLIVKTAQEHGFLAHEKITVEGRFNWEQISNLHSNQDLFSSKKIIELSNPDAKFDTQAGKILSHYCTQLTNDTLLLIVSSKLNSSQTRSSWYQEIDKKGACLTIWPLNPNELQQWLNLRFHKAQLKASLSAIKLLAELCENNLLAMQQAIEKLKLLLPAQTDISQEDILKTISDHSRYTIFDFINYVLKGNPSQLLHVLAVLRQQGTEPTLVLWMLAKEIRHLLDLLEQAQQGQSLQQLIDREIFSKRPFLQTALRRLNIPLLQNLLAQLTEIDQSIKGMNEKDPWLCINRFALALGGCGL